MPGDELASLLEVKSPSEPGLFSGSGGQADQANATREQFASQSDGTKIEVDQISLLGKIARLLQNGEEFSYPIYVINGAVQYVTLPDTVMAGDWEIAGIFAYADAAAAASQNVIIQGLFRGFDFQFVAPKGPVALNAVWMELGFRLRDGEEKGSFTVTTTGGVAGERSFLMLRMRRIG